MSQFGSILQRIETSDGNSSTTNLASGATFTGTAEEALGINGIQMYLFADQNCTVYIDQSLDGTNWDLSDQHIYYANEACTRVVISAAPYFRIRATNDGDVTTTTFRIAAGMTPIINPLPRSLTSDGRLMNESTLVGQQNTERHVWVSPTNTLSVNSRVRLVGTNFDGTTKDTNFWQETVTNTGSVTQAGKITLSTGTTADSTALYETVDKARFVVGTSNQFVGAFKFVTINETDNIRRCGAYTDDDGGFFQLDGGTFGLGFRSEGSDVFINSGSFNGNYGASLTIAADTPYKLESEWTPLGGFYYVNGVLLHSVSPSSPPQTLTWPIRMENINDNGNTSDVDFECYGAAILKQGALSTNQTSKFIVGNANTTICKVGAGAVKGIIISSVVDDTEIDFYDGLTTADPLLWTSGGIKAKTDYEPIPVDFFGMPFSDGLTIEVSVSACDILVIYE